MRSARSDAFWQAYCRHHGLNHARHEVTEFRTPPDVADRLLALMVAGRMRATSGPTCYFREGRGEPVPEVGDYAVLLDRGKQPRLIWRTTGVTISPFRDVTDEFIWRSGQGTGERDDWLRRISGSFRLQEKRYGFEMHDRIETMFETLEVVWPLQVAERLRLLTPLLDRGAEFVRRVAKQRDFIRGLEAVLARLQIAVITVTADLRIGFVNPAAETLLARGDGVLVRNNRLGARWPSDDQSLAKAVREANDVPGTIAAPGPAHWQRERLVMIHRGGERPAYRATIFPPRPGRSEVHAVGATRAIVFIDDPDDDQEPTQTETLAVTFHLTPAEARLAAHLASGLSLTEAADLFGVTRNTVRAQLRALFDKMDIHRQSDLVRIVQRSRGLRLSQP